MSDRSADRGSSAVLARVGSWLWGQPWLLLVGMATLFGANGIAARLATGEMSPLVLVFLRWCIVCLALMPILSRPQRDEVRWLLRAHRGRLAWMSLLAFAGYNAVFFTAAYHTSAINLTLLQSSIPPFTLFGAALVFGTRVRAPQVLGMLLTFLGVLVVAAKGDLGALSQLRLNASDVSIILVCAGYAAYLLGLRTRPATSALAFFAALAIVSTLWAVPMALYEIATGHAYWPSLKGWLVVLFIAFGPSFAAQVFFLRGVDLIGPGRAGLAPNLVPIAGALGAVLILHEPFTLADGCALVLGIGGVSLAEWSVARALRRERSA